MSSNKKEKETTTSKMLLFAKMEEQRRVFFGVMLVMFFLLAGFLCFDAQPVCFFPHRTSRAMHQVAATIARAEITPVTRLPRTRKYQSAYGPLTAALIM